LRTKERDQYIRFREPIDWELVNKTGILKIADLLTDGNLVNKISMWTIRDPLTNWKLVNEISMWIIKDKLTKWELVNEIDLLDLRISRNGTDPKTSCWMIYPLTRLVKKKSKAILVIGCGDPQVCETSQLPNFLDRWLKDGDKVVSLMCRLPFFLKEDSWYSFLLEAESISGP
jgi:hypothetical protein